MKKKILLFGLLLVLLSAFAISFSSCASTANETVTLYVYNWGEYISDGSEGSLDVNAAFEEYCREELGLNVTVNYSTFSSNESMYAKISSGSSAYDVIIPSDYMIERMVKEDLLLPLVSSKDSAEVEKVIPNYKDIDEKFKGENIYYEGDAKELYSVPYFYGMIGVIYNTSIVNEADEDIGSWELMWDEDYKGDILQFNNSRDAFGTAFYKLGYDVNDESKEKWRAALDELLRQKEIVQGYVMDEIFNKMQSGSAAVAAYYAGDFLSMHEQNPDLEFFYPKEGTNIYIDSMCIPKASQHPELAKEYINFMCQEEIAVENALYTYYASPLTSVVNNEDYQEAMAEVKENAIDLLYGEEATSVPSQAYLNLSSEGLQQLNVLWEELKSQSRIGQGIYIGCGLILGVIAIITVTQIVKKRRWSKLYD